MFGDADLGYVNLKGSGPIPKIGTTKKKSGGGFVEGMLFWWGIVLPLAALLVESNSHFCAKQFFDPLPTSGHAMLFALIPVTNFLAWASLKWDMSPHYAFMLFCNGMAVGVAILYSLMFLPITHVSMLGILYFGIGLLGLAPLLSLISLMKGGSLLAKKAKNTTYVDGHHVKHLGHLLVLTLVVAVETPSTFTRIALGMASKPETRQQGLDLLRAFGSPEVMLRACYERSGRATDIVGSMYESHDPLPIEKARDLFYRVTGRTFNSFPIPESARATMRNAGFVADDGIEGAVDDEFDLDPDIAGEMVSGVSRGLSVSKSDMSGTVDSNAAIAKFDWYLNFKNKSKFDREVRTRIKLPHGGVVNKASLIVDGKEYEATITVRSLAREIYRQAVARKKNPLLVSTTGTDSVLVQVFPVPPSDMREVRLHLGVVAPMELDRQRQGVVVLPQFEERNFQISAPHTISVASNGEMKADFKDLKVGKNEQGKFTLIGSLDPSKLASGDGIIHASRNVKATTFSAPDTWSEPGHIAVEKIEDITAEAPRKLIAVIDGSGTMGSSINAIADSFNNLPAETELSIFFVRDDKKQHLTGNRNEIINQLKRMPCSGGQIDGQDLLEALQESADSNSAVLWIHGAQPIDSPYKTVIQSLAKSAGNRTILYDMQILSGPNQILDGMESVASIQTLPHTGQVDEDLKLLFDAWSQKLKAYKIVRSAVAPTVVAARGAAKPADRQVGHLIYSTFNANDSQALKPATVPGAEATVSDLAQLMAYDRVLQDMRENTYQSKQDAIDLAARYHIVTPMSSAVLVTEVPELNCVSSEPQKKVNVTKSFIDYLATGGLNDINRQLSSITEPTPETELSFNEAKKQVEPQMFRQMHARKAATEAPTCADSPAPAPCPAGSFLGRANQAIAPRGDNDSSLNGTELSFASKDFRSRGTESDKMSAQMAKPMAPALMEGLASGAASSDKLDNAPAAARAKGETFGGGMPAAMDGAQTGASGTTGETLDGATNGTVVPQSAEGAQAPLVPESDTYLLLAAAMGVLAAVMYRNRLLTAKKA